MPDVIALLRDCVTLVAGADDLAGETGFGTGFFVAPGRVLTCGHVVEACRGDLVIHWRRKRYAVRVGKLVPSDAGAQRYHALPDLALLELVESLDHPIVWLASGPPQRGSIVTAVGYSRWVMPRRGDSSEHEAQSLTEVRLNVAGREGDSWRVADDVLAPGQSGSPVLDMASGRIVGMVKAKIDFGRRQVTGGWIIGADSIVDELADVVAANATVHSQGSVWRDAATHRVQLANEIFGARWRAKDSPLSQSALPSSWLDPHNHIVPFVAPPVFKVLRDGWCLAENRDVATLRLMHAPGGVGKTRLSLELADELQRAFWIAGLVQNDQSLASFIHSLPALLRAGHRVFCAVDYAETSVVAVRRLIETLAQHQSKAVRILLLARTAGTWWEKLSGGSAAQFIDPEPLALADIGRGDQVALALNAYRSFRKELLGDSDAGNRPIPDALKQMVEGQSRALDLHAAALVQVLNEAGTARQSGDPLEALLQHEREYWRRAAKAQAGVTFAEVDRLSDRLLAVPTLCPAADAHMAEEAIARLPDEGEHLPCPAEHLATTLAYLYPGDGGRFWSPLVPDRVGEKLLASVIKDSQSAQRAADEFVRLVGNSDSTQAAHVITLLSRVAGLTDPTTVSREIADRAYTLITRLSSHSPAVFGPPADQVLTTAGGQRASSNTATLSRPLSAGMGAGSFSDTANILGAAYRSWIGAAFSSSRRSAGYDHRKMGITARGAWESVKRHFRDMGINTQTQDFTVVGIGDMSGDVFGNGMLLSEHIGLVAAFDHRHILLDPHPDRARSFVERQRLFGLPSSSWDDYDTSLISEGGGVYSRGVKSIPISSQVHTALGLGDRVTAMSPAELMKAILLAPVDLLWSGGIGTYVKAKTESHTDVSDKANDATRVNGAQLRCKVVGEGGNLSFTQSGRIEFVRAGGHIYTDFIDNSSGVDCFDHEVNIKVLLEAAVTDGRLKPNARHHLLEETANDVAKQVLRNSRNQASALCGAKALSEFMLPVHRRMLVDLERRGQLSRSVEHLADEAELTERAEAGLGLYPPELAVLLAHEKIHLANEVGASTLPDEDWTDQILAYYFPVAVRSRFAHLLPDHPLRREIVGTRLVHEAVDRAGVAFVYQLCEETGADTADVLRDYHVVREIFSLTELWQAIDAMDNMSLTAQGQLSAYSDVQSLLSHAVGLLVSNRRSPVNVGQEIVSLKPGISRLLPEIRDLLPGTEQKALQTRVKSLVKQGIPETLAEWVAQIRYATGLISVVGIASAASQDAASVARLYYAVSERYRFNGLLAAIDALPNEDRWQARARMVLRRDLYHAHADLTLETLSSTSPGTSSEERIAEWELKNHSAIANVRRQVGEAIESGQGIATLMVLMRAIRNLIHAPYQLREAQTPGLYPNRRSRR